MPPYLALLADPNLPAFLARPQNAPVYHGFPLLKDSEGFVFGAITEPNGAEPAEWSDVFVVAPNGSLASIVWHIGDGEPTIICEPGRIRLLLCGSHYV